MTVGLYFLEDVLDLALWADHESGPGNAHHLLAVHVLLDQYAIGYGDLLVGISEQCKGQTLLVGEFSLRRRSIWGYAKQHGARLLNLSI